MNAGNIARFFSLSAASGGEGWGEGSSERTHSVNACPFEKYRGPILMQLPTTSDLQWTLTRDGSFIVCGQTAR